MVYQEILRNVVFLLGVPIGRSVLGWAKNSFEDGRVSDLEWRQLGATVVRVGGLGVMAWLGLDALGVGSPEVLASVGAFLADKVLSAIKRR